MQQLGLRTEKSKPMSTTAAASGATKRRAECTSLGPGTKDLSLRWLTLVWPRRDVPRRFAWFFSSQASEPYTMTDCCCRYVYSRMIRSHEGPALGALLFSVSRSKPASTDNCSLSAEKRGDCVRASWLYSFSNASITTRTTAACAVCKYDSYHRTAVN